MSKVNTPAAETRRTIGKRQCVEARLAHPQLRRLAEELFAIAERLQAEASSGATISRCSETFSKPLFEEVPSSCPATTAGSVSIFESPEGGRSDASSLRQVYCDMAAALYQRRRSRAALFDNADLFGEPAWDILLDLYIAFNRRDCVSVSSACIGSAAPPTTGLRWLSVLCEKGLTTREHDPADQRRVLVRLTPRAVAAMDSYFAGMNEFRCEEQPEANGN